MDELWPDPGNDIDIAARLAGDNRPKPEGRPWVTMIMIASLDGRISIDGVSGPLGAPSDQKRFSATRKLADTILVGATTVRVEDYRPARARIAVITGSLSPDPSARLFFGPGPTPLLFTTTQAAESRGGNFVGIAEVCDLGDSIDCRQVLADLDGRGDRHVVLEGGPSLNAQFLEHDLVDEILLSVSPIVVGGDGPTIASGPSLGPDHRFALDRVGVGDGIVFLRYLRRPTTSAK